MKLWSWVPEHVETHSLVQANPSEYLASMMYLMQHALSSIPLMNLHASEESTSLSISKAERTWFYVFLITPPHIPQLCLPDSSSLTSGCSKWVVYWSILHRRSWTWMPSKNKIQAACSNSLVSSWIKYVIVWIHPKFMHSLVFQSLTDSVAFGSEVYLYEWQFPLNISLI